ncbi:MAG: hypothetical protein AB7H66_04160 [Hyphomonadaceae bacterium]
MRALLLTAAIGLAACAASPAADSGAPDPNLAFALGTDLNCNSGDMRQCPVGGCAPGQEGEHMTLHISLHVPDRGGEGRFCIATGCEDADFEPTLTRALGWTAIMRTDDRTNYAADLEISRDLRSFTLRQADSSSIDTWTGECSPAGS